MAPKQTVAKAMTSVKADDVIVKAGAATTMTVERLQQIMPTKPPKGVVVQPLVQGEPCIVNVAAFCKWNPAR